MKIWSLENVTPAVGRLAVCTSACKVVGGQFELVICFVQRAEVGTVGIQKGSKAADRQMGGL